MGFTILHDFSGIKKSHFWTYSTSISRLSKTIDLFTPNVYLHLEIWKENGLWMLFHVASEWLVKGIVHPIMKVCWKCIHTQAIQDVDGFVSSSDLEKCSIPSLAHQWMLCSEWVPSEWESKLIKITIIHKKSTPLQSIIKMFLTSNRCLWLKYESITHIIILSHLNQERNIHRSSTIYKRKQSKQSSSK